MQSGTAPLTRWGVFTFNLTGFVAVIFLTLFVVHSKADRCRIVALSGGGDKGSYEAGVLHGLINGLPAPEAQWDVVTGISAGSINLGGLISYELGDEADAADFLVNTALSLGKNDVYRRWIGGALQGILFESGIYDSEPLMKTLKHLLPGPFYRRYVIGATSYLSGSLVTWNETLPASDVPTALRASAAIPGIFESVKFQDDLFGDGGIKEGINILDGIERCLEITTDLSEISVDAVLAMNYDASDAETSQVKNVLRNRSLFSPQHLFCCAVVGVACHRHKPLSFCYSFAHISLAFPPPSLLFLFFICFPCFNGNV